MILVTGAQGLVGRELVRMLVERGDSVRGVDLLPQCAETRGADHVVGDLCDPAVCTLACAGVASIVHTAARQYHSGVPRIGRRRFFSANVTMTRNLLDAAVAAGARRFVLVSSDMVYGIPRQCPIDEEHETSPIGPYGASKLESERVCELARERGVCVTILRPRLIVGPGRLGVLRRLFDRVREHRSVPMLGDGRNRYQMVAVADVARACALAVHSRCDATLNLGSADPPPVRELLADLIRRAGSRSRLRSIPRGAANAALSVLQALRVAPLHAEQSRIATVDYVLSTRLASRLLGWKPAYSDADMLFGAYDSYVAPPRNARGPGTP